MMKVRVLLASVLLTGCAAQSSIATAPRPSEASDLPNHALTPGGTLPVDLAALCVPGYSATVRNVPMSERLAVFAAYHIPYADHARYEVDHLISLELGGSNAITNLWP